MSDKIVMVVDMVGRTILGKEVENSNPDFYSLANPAVVHIQPLQGGKLQVQVLPMVIPEFITSSKRKDDLVINFSRLSLAIPQDMEVDAQLVSQYTRIFSPIIQPAPESAPVINLFDKK